MVSRKKLPRVLSAGVLLVILAISLVASGDPIFRCRINHVARRTCCCPTAERTQHGTDEASISKKSCCDVETVELGRTAGEVSSESARAIRIAPEALAVVVL